MGGVDSYLMAVKEWKSNDVLSPMSILSVVIALFTFVCTVIG